MITVSADYRPARAAPHAGARSVIARPNQSADWSTNKRLLLAASVVLGIIATFFSMVGLWMVLPFAGLEITALGSALYVVCKKLNQRHILHFAGDELYIEKGSRGPEQVWRLPARHVFISVERRRHPWDPVRLTLCCHTGGHAETIAIGEFLNREDSELLLATLRDHGLAVRNDSPTVKAPI